VFGLIGAATLSAQRCLCGEACRPFLSFALPCLVPAIVYLFWNGAAQQQGWGVLGLILPGVLECGGVAGQPPDPARAVCGAFRTRR
jgi:hypothetical protein